MIVRGVTPSLSSQRNYGSINVIVELWICEFKNLHVRTENFSEFNQFHPTWQSRSKQSQQGSHPLFQSSWQPAWELFDKRRKKEKFINSLHSISEQTQNPISIIYPLLYFALL
jgi:ribosomal protein RSM22 (predicted rRNA methylase)